MFLRFLTAIEAKICETAIQDLQRKQERQVCAVSRKKIWLQFAVEKCFSCERLA